MAVWCQLHGFWPSIVWLPTTSASLMQHNSCRVSDHPTHALIPHMSSLTINLHPGIMPKGAIIVTESNPWYSSVLLLLVCRMHQQSKWTKSQAHCFMERWAPWTRSWGPLDIWLKCWTYLRGRHQWSPCDHSWGDITKDWVLRIWVSHDLISTPWMAAFINHCICGLWYDNILCPIRN